MPLRDPGIKYGPPQGPGELLAPQRISSQREFWWSPRSWWEIPPPWHFPACTHCTWTLSVPSLPQTFAQELLLWRHGDALGGTGPSVLKADTREMWGILIWFSHSFYGWEIPSEVWWGHAQHPKAFLKTDPSLAVVSSFPLQWMSVPFEWSVVRVMHSPPSEVSRLIHIIILFETLITEQ